ARGFHDAVESHKGGGDESHARSLLPAPRIAAGARESSPAGCEHAHPSASNGATWATSATSAARASRRVAAARERSTDDGCTVAITTGARSVSRMSRPRSRLTRNERPNSACDAVAPSVTRTRGFTTASSALSHGLHASISRAFGGWWIRRLPRGSHLKCFTAFVT